MLCWTDAVLLITRAYLLKFIRSILMVVTLLCLCFILFQILFEFRPNFVQISVEFWSNFQILILQF
uniref:Uncharacterized protein n=1 Tax=Triticum urartu TaxID=4572 RepID=A0A8R7P792_TRIUA